MKKYLLVVLFLLTGCVSSSENNLSNADKSKESALVGDWKLSGMTVFDVNVGMNENAVKSFPIFSFKIKNKFDFLNNNKNSILKNHFGEDIVVNDALYEVLSTKDTSKLVISFLVGENNIITEVRTIEFQLGGAVSLGVPKTFFDGVIKKDNKREEARARKTKYLLTKIK